MIRSILTILLLACTVVGLNASRIKDLTMVEGARSNQLIGYGLVVGLAGDGDGSSSEATLQSVANMLSRFGIQVNTEDIKSDNVAAVMITAEIGPFTREGTRLDVVVSSISDAKTIQGGVLLQTPLRGADDVVYAVAQGPIAVGGFLGGAGGSTVQKNHPTVGRIPGGAIVEREVPTEIVQRDMVNLLLLNPDFTTAVRMAHAINKEFPGVAQAMDASSVNVIIPDNLIDQVANFLARLTTIEVVPDITARVIINERTGTIVATQNVRISKVAISHGSLTVSVTQNNQVSQPAPLAPAPPAGATPDTTENGATIAPGGNTVVYANTDTAISEGRGGFRVVEDLPTLDELTSALNALGVSTRDMMSILQSLKAAGALQAELIIQ